MAFPANLTGTVDGPAIVNVQGPQPMTDGDTMILNGRAWARRQPTARKFVPNIETGAAAITAVGTSAVHVAGTLYICEFPIYETKVCTGMQACNGTVVGTDNLILAIYSPAVAGVATLLANTALAGTLSAGASAFQTIPFVTAVTLPPGLYWAVLQCNGTTATSRRVATGTANVIAGSQAGVFGTIPATLTVPTTFTADMGPVVCAYS